MTSLSLHVPDPAKSEVHQPVPPGSFGVPLAARSLLFLSSKKPCPVQARATFRKARAILFPLPASDPLFCFLASLGPQRASVQLVIAA
jgi:hypothetical protein